MRMNSSPLRYSVMLASTAAFAPCASFGLAYLPRLALITRPILEDSSVVEDNGEGVLVANHEQRESARFDHENRWAVGC